MKRTLGSLGMAMTVMLVFSGGALGIHCATDRPAIARSHWPEKEGIERNMPAHDEKGDSCVQPIMFNSPVMRDTIC